MAQKVIGHKMKRLSFIGIFAPILLIGSIASAWDLSSNVKESRDQLTVSGEVTDFTLPSGTLNGTGLNIDFEHFISRRSGVDIFLATAINGQQSVSSTFTGLGVYYYYAPFSDCCAQTREVSINGSPTLRDTIQHPNLWQFGVGVNEYLLNGTRSVYSASGLGVGVAYSFHLFNLDFKSQLRYAQLVSNSISIQGIALSLGLNFGL